MPIAVIDNRPQAGHFANACSKPQKIDNAAAAPDSMLTDEFEPITELIAPSIKRRGLQVNGKDLTDQASRRSDQGIALARLTGSAVAERI
jgi:hypothetical protein